jgi:N-glycosylase/DNA lyase
MKDSKLMIIRLRNQCPFKLDLTLSCGQAFRWDMSDGWWRGVVGDNLIKIRQDRKALCFEGIDEDSLLNYLGFMDDLPRIFIEINKDKHMRVAIDRFKGLRILRQDAWECLISYICATFKNIASIKRMLFKLSRRFGEEVKGHNESFFTFPSPKELARCSITELRKCELGYRAEYVAQTSRRVFEEDFDLERLKRMAYDEARRVLLEFPGVGQKVADCVLLFGLGKLEAFPVDVWVMRAVLRRYPSHFSRELVARVLKEESLSDSQYKRLSEFGRQYYGRYAGYAQEYLYHYERMDSKRRCVN